MGLMMRILIKSFGAIFLCMYMSSFGENWKVITEYIILLKHKDSFGKSENLSKIFFAEILVFDHDYEGKSSSSNGLLWISFIKKKKIY